MYTHFQEIFVTVQKKKQKKHDANEKSKCIMIMNIQFPL